MSQPEKTNLSLIDIRVANDNVKLIRAYLDKGFKSGQYSMEDAETIINLMSNMGKVVENLDIYQKFVVANMKKDAPATPTL
jgi:hypothetical protein